MSVFNAAVRPVSAAVQQWKGFRMQDRFDGKIDIEIRPMEMMGGRQLDIREFANGRFPEPRELVERNKEFLIVDEQPEPVPGNVGYLNLTEYRWTHSG